MIVQEKEKLFLVGSKSVESFFGACVAMRPVSVKHKGRNFIGYGNLLDDKGSLSLIDYLLMHSLQPKRKQEHVEINWERLHKMGIEQAHFIDDDALDYGVNWARVVLKEKSSIQVSESKKPVSIRAGAVSGVISAQALNKMERTPSGACNLWVSADSVFLANFSGTVRVAANSDLRYGHARDSDLERCRVKGFDIAKSSISQLTGDFVAVLESKFDAAVRCNVASLIRTRFTKNCSVRINHSSLYDSYVKSSDSDWGFLSMERISHSQLSEVTTRYSNLFNINAFKCSFADSTISGGVHREAHCKDSELHGCNVINSKVQACQISSTIINAKKLNKQFIGD